MTKEAELRTHIDFIRDRIKVNQLELEKSIEQISIICSHKYSSVEDVPVKGDTWSKGGKHVNTNCDHCGKLLNTFYIDYGDYD